MAARSGPAGALRRGRRRGLRSRPRGGRPAAALLLAATLVGCGSLAPAEPDPSPTGRPDAPPQPRPLQAAEQTGRTTAAPLAELPDADWLAEVAADTGIPERPLAAYAGASLHLAESRPDCRIGWTTLAGIGRVESVHGSHGGSQIAEDGTVRPEIIGIPLDGRPGTREIVDTDGGELDGDDVWDRAVGPMQFIPTTWERRGRDGNRDGVADPQQYDDAALAAAGHLCAHGGDLTEDSGWNAAVAAYNQSDNYARSVAGWAEDYAAAR
ncbi:lytic transglycosylase domain-containing protein [Nesterenkonia halophila]|uniref:lytic transglycosylase domain-containing protein n=1 Tax=Nesterenkonia halophila TaxID=302044 RepID=UPI001290B639|nr:lytic murein transglycosylase [Nesterenkonia halophila]